MSQHTLRNMMLVSLMLKESRVMSSNASHNDMLVALVIRHVNRLMQPWDCETRLMNTLEPVVTTTSDDWPVWPRRYSSTRGFAADWLAVLFLLPIVATSSEDSDTDRLPNINQIFKLTVQKALLFIEYWTKRTGSSAFQEAVINKAIEIMTTSDGRRLPQILFPAFWALEAQND